MRTRSRLLTYRRVVQLASVNGSLNLRTHTSGQLKGGKFIRLVPYPVSLGFVNGLAIVIAKAQWSHFNDPATGSFATMRCIFTPAHLSRNQSLHSRILQANSWWESKEVPCLASRPLRLR